MFSDAPQFWMSHKRECVSVLNLLVIFFSNRFPLVFTCTWFLKTFININSACFLTFDIFTKNNTTISLTSEYQVIIPKITYYI